jgi:hypothetical protein
VVRRGQDFEIISFFREAFPKLKFWEGNLKNRSFARVKTLKNCKGLSQNRAR